MQVLELQRMGTYSQYPHLFPSHLNHSLGNHESELDHNQGSYVPALICVVSTKLWCVVFVLSLLLSHLLMDM